MSTTWKWILGLALATVAVISALFAWNPFFSPGGYRMMGYSYGWHMPMMYGSGTMGLSMMYLTWIILVGLLVLIILGIVWLVKDLAMPK